MQIDIKNNLFTAAWITKTRPRLNVMADINPGLHCTSIYPIVLKSNARHDQSERVNALSNASEPTGNIAIAL